MSKRGENIYKRKDRRWEGRYIKGHDPQGKARFGYVYAQSYREAKEKLAMAKTLGEQQKPAIHRPFAEYSGEWLILRRSQVKESTYVKYRSILELHLDPAFGRYLPQDIHTVEVEAFSHTLLQEQALSPKTVRDILMVLQAVLQYIRKQEKELLPEIEVVYPKENKKEMRVLTPAEQAAFIQFLQTDTDACKGGVLLALLTGLRIGEICALRWGDISLEEGAIRVSRTMQRLQKAEQGDGHKTHILVSEPKSQTSKRVIPLSAQAMALCRQMAIARPEAYVLTGKVTEFMEPRSLQYRLSRYTKACGLEGVHFHSLRHTFATRCVEVGFEIKSLSEILGHATTKVTLDRYVHSSMELKRANMNKLAAVGL